MLIALSCGWLFATSRLLRCLTDHQDPFSFVTPLRIQRGPHAHCSFTLLNSGDIASRRMTKHVKVHLSSLITPHRRTQLWWKKRSQINQDRSWLWLEVWFLSRSHPSHVPHPCASARRVQTMHDSLRTMTEALDLTPFAAGTVGTFRFGSDVGDESGHALEVPTASGTCWYWLR